jgi:hypothetical protein
MSDPNDATIANRDRWEDPIVAEVRRIRDQLFAEAGGTLEGLVAMLRAREATHEHELITLAPRRPEPGSDAA